MEREVLIKSGLQSSWRTPVHDSLLKGSQLRKSRLMHLRHLKHLNILKIKQWLLQQSSEVDFERVWKVCFKLFKLCWRFTFPLWYFAASLKTSILSSYRLSSIFVNKITCFLVFLSNTLGDKSGPNSTTKGSLLNSMNSRKVSIVIFPFKSTRSSSDYK